MPILPKPTHEVLNLKVRASDYSVPIAGYTSEYFVNILNRVLRRQKSAYTVLESSTTHIILERDKLTFKVRGVEPYDFLANRRVGTLTIRIPITKKYIIRVSAKDIKFGKRENPKACPIHRSVKRTVGGRDVEITHHVRVGDVGYTLPDEAVRFIEIFDDVGPTAVRPFKFLLEI